MKKAGYLGMGEIVESWCKKKEQVNMGKHVNYNRGKNEQRQSKVN